MIKIALIIIAVGIILLTLLQSGKTDGMGAFTGSGSLKLFETSKERGGEKLITEATVVLSALFFVLIGVEYMIH